MNNLFIASSNQPENRGANAPQKITFKKAKNNVMCSLNEVGFFFCNFNRFLKYVKLYNLLK